MASAWGDAWGDAWGSAWGAIVTTIPDAEEVVAWKLEIVNTNRSISIQEGVGSSISFGERNISGV